MTMAPERSSSQSLKSSALFPRKLKSPQAALAAVMLAVFVSVLGTLIHQTRFLELPVGVTVALGLTLWASYALRITARKASGWIFTVTLAILITAFAQEANDVMIPATDLGSIWAYGSIGIAAVVTAFPKLPKDVWSRKL